MDTDSDSETPVNTPEADYVEGFTFGNPITPAERFKSSRDPETTMYKIVAELLAPVKREIDSIKIELMSQRTKDEELKRENKQLKEKIAKLEGQSKKKNLVFLGFREQRGESKYDYKRMILSTLQRSGIQIHPKGIENAYRKGPFNVRKQRPIIVTFFHYEEKEFVLAKSAHVKRMTNIRIEEDYPEEVEKNRRLLKPILNKAVYERVNGKPKYHASLQLDKLNVNGELYTVDTINNLPDDIHPTVVYTPCRNNITAFFGNQSPFSNHYLAPQKIDKKTFNSNEQYYMFEKAKTFNDNDTAAKILSEKNPALQKQLGNNIKNFKESTWRTRCLDVMRRGLEAKMEQNPSIKNFLLATKSNMLLEANPSDPYWGVGMSLYDRRLWVKNSWTGTAENHLGRLLSELRTEYKRT